MGKGRGIKRDVRLFRATDAMYMTLGYDARHSDWEDVEVDRDGYRLSICSGREGERTVTTYSMSWDTVANELGFDVCEHVLNHDNAKFVLLYNYEEEK